MDPALAAEFFRQRHPVKTAECTAAETGMSLPAARKLLERYGGLGYVNFVRCVSACGPEFLSFVMPNVPGWLHEAVRAERRRQLEAESALIDRRREALR